MALAAIAIHHRLVNSSGPVIDGLMAGDTQGIWFRRRQQRSALTGSMAGGTFTTCHGSMDLGLQQAGPVRTMGGMATDTRAADNMTKMGLSEGFSLYVMTTETKGIGLLNQQLRLPGAMGIMTEGTAILQRRMDVFPLEILSGVALIARFIHCFLQQMILGSIMAGVTFSALALLHGLMNRDIAHGRGQLLVAAEAKAGRFLTQKNTTYNSMGEMAGAAGIISHRLVNIPLPKSSCHNGMAILTSLARSLPWVLLNAGTQTPDQDKQDNKLTYFP